MPAPFIWIVVLGTLSVWIGGKVLLRLVFKNALAEHYFDILIIGFFFLGFSHYYVTLKTLGHGRARAGSAFSVPRCWCTS